MTDIFLGILTESWQVLNAFAIYCLMGLFISGILKSFFSDSFVERHLGANDFRSVVKAALIGIPLPLCSCGVIPVATGLHRQGAGKGPTTAFLIATPETGVDSIAVTYALLDPLMTLIRPIAAFFTAMTAGGIVSCLPEAKQQKSRLQEPGGTCSCCCTQQKTPRTCEGRHSLRERVSAGLHFAFDSLLAEIGPPLLLGVLIAGTIAYSVPSQFIQEHLGSGMQQMIVMLLIGIPLYVCAIASTPIVAALALKGLTPGAALVFLLTGPATNIATIMIVARMMGKRIAAVYVGVIATASLVLGSITDLLYHLLSLDTRAWVSVHSHAETGLITPAAAVVLLACIFRARRITARRQTPPAR